VSFLARVAVLLGFSAYAKAPALTAGAPNEKALRKAMGGQLTRIPTSQSRWYQDQVEAAERAADHGDLERMGRLCRAVRSDGKISGVLSTRTDGLVRLPKKFRGPDHIVRELESRPDSPRSTFDEMFPAAELALLAADGILAGVGVAEMVPVEGRDHPVMVRHDPEFLRYRWNENRWYFSSIAGLIPITPGDGRWILHLPGGRVAPWQHGLWRSLGRAWIRKQHAQLYKDSWEAKLANPARVAVSPNGAGEEQKQSWFRQVMAWGVNTVFGVGPGYDVKLVESNGRGYECFLKTIEQCDTENTIALAGQVVTTTGGAGFVNGDMFRAISSDLIQCTADAVAHTINTQGLPAWIYDRFGEEALDESTSVEWDTTPPKDQAQLAATFVTTTTAIKSLNEALATSDLEVDVAAMCTRFAVPTKARTKPAATVTEDDDAPTLELVRDAA
jgi:phage gp29-like protein